MMDFRGDIESNDTNNNYYDYYNHHSGLSKETQSTKRVLARLCIHPSTHPYHVVYHDQKKAL